MSFKSGAHRAAEVACELAVARTAKLEAEVADLRAQLADANANTAAAQRMAERFAAQAQDAVAAAERALGKRPLPSTSTVGELGPCPRCGAAGFWCVCRRDVLDAFTMKLAQARR
jgi:hypothetical protein